jgi:starch synthase
VTKRGGLKDTVTPFDDSHPDGTGVLADWASADSFQGAVEYALDLFGQPEKWRRLRRNGMKRDSSWAASAREYARVYERVLS